MTIDQKKSQFSQRLNFALDEIGFSKKNKGRQRELADLFNVSQIGARKWLEGESIPRYERVIEIADRFGLRVEWLLYGEPPMYRVGETRGKYSNEALQSRQREQALVEIFRELSPAGQARALSILQALADTDGENPN